MARERPKTGEPRETHQPVKIDKLPAQVHEDILFLRNQRGKTWQEIADQSGEKYNEDWKGVGGGFVNWDKLDTRVLELFPELRIPRTNLHRWYDLRVEQVRSDAIRRSEQAREIAETFAKASLPNSDEAAVNAARDLIMGLIVESSDAKSREKAARGLTRLAEVMIQAKANQIKERKVSADERRITLLEKREEMAIKKLQREADELAKKHAKGELKADDLAEIVQRTFGFAPKRA